MPRRYRFAFVLLVVLWLASGCQPAQPTALPPPAVAQPTPFPLTATLLPTVTLEPALSPTPPATLTPTIVPSPRTLTGVPPPACQNPSATITSPPMNSQVAGLIEIRGTATHPIMLYWKVEYRTDGNTDYAMLNNGDAPVTYGVLANLSTTTLPNGVYWLRLSVVQKDGNYAVPCEIRITIANP